MRKNQLGTLLYKSTALIPVKVFLMTIFVILTVNLYFQTYLDSDFLKWHRTDFWGVIDFHLFYPEQVISLFLSTFLPTFYYSFIRGIEFYEKGILVNRGLPFMNQIVLYSEIESYKIVHKRYLMSVHRKTIKEDLLFSIRDIDRSVAILDQHDIPGNLGQGEFSDVMTTSKKLVIFYLVFTIIVSILQFSGFFIWINKYLFR